MRERRRCRTRGGSAPARACLGFGSGGVRARRTARRPRSSRRRSGGSGASRSNTAFSPERPDQYCASATRGGPERSQVPAEACRRAPCRPPIGLPSHRSTRRERRRARSPPGPRGVTCTVGSRYIAIAERRRVAVRPPLPDRVDELGARARSLLEQLSEQREELVDVDAVDRLPERARAVQRAFDDALHERTQGEGVAIRHQVERPPQQGHAHARGDRRSARRATRDRTDRVATRARRTDSPGTGACIATRCSTASRTGTRRRRSSIWRSSSARFSSRRSSTRVAAVTPCSSSRRILARSRPRPGCVWRGRRASGRPLERPRETMWRFGTEGGTWWADGWRRSRLRSPPHSS